MELFPGSIALLTAQPTAAKPTKRRRKDAPMFDSETSMLYRDEGIALVAGSAGEAWMHRAMTLVLLFLRKAGERGALFEDARAYAVDMGLPRPPHHNAWGAVSMALAARLLIVKTGEYQASRSIKSHGRTQPYWRVR